ncbi:MAG: SAM-dependent methyltransferase, tRNA(uracil-5)-methyltransferase [Acidimicrobiales bacterium]|nr:SAM-dependent methyltransferase, tRNA(uracil-5)-methyltransferase [Acidimicrobiales bacterium]
MTILELRTTGMAVGGEAVAREPSGRVVFVSGAGPGETVLVELTDERKSFARGLVVGVVSPSADRVEPPCPHVAEGCGGCDWQHLAVDAQRDLRAQQAVEVLRRTAGIGAPEVRAGVALAAEGLRTTVRGTTDPEGHFAFRRRRSHEPVAVDSCLIAHPLVEDIIARGWFGPATDVTIRVGARTGERMVIVGPTAKGVRVPEGVTVVGTDELAAGHRAWIHEEVAGRTWRISARSFFQASPEGAEALVAEVGALVGRWAPDGRRLVDLCSGVGLFAGTVGLGRAVVGVERNASAVADARHNLADTGARFVKVALGRWRPSPAEVVVADPAAGGLTAEGVAAVSATGAGLCVLVSCDPASLGRDAKLLADAGYEHVGSSVLDLFGHTGQLEVVSGFRRDADARTVSP